MFSHKKSLEIRRPIELVRKKSKFKIVSSENAIILNSYYMQYSKQPPKILPSQDEISFTFFQRNQENVRFQ